MIRKIVFFYNNFINLGVRKNINKSELKKIHVLNLYCLIWYLFLTLHVVSNFHNIISFHNNKFILLNFVFIFCLVIFIQVLQYFNHYIKARLLFTISLTSFIFFYSNFVDAYKATFLEFFFVFPPCISLIFFNNKKIHFTILVISFCCLFIPNLFFQHYPKYIYNHINTVILYFSIIIMISYFKNLNSKNEKALEERSKELETINNFQSQFFINISHEIRTPLTLINGDIAALKNYEHKVPQLKRVKENLHTEVTKITAMVNDVLDLSKMEASNFDLNIKNISATELIEQLFASFETIFDQKKITFQLNPINYNYLIDADTIQLSRAISNIIVNASKYTDINEEVTMSLTKKNNTVIISIQDTGIDVSTEEIDKICNQFYQVKNHINDAGGSGVGLSLTKEIINLHNGKLTIESEVGLGSTFNIILPLKETLPLISIMDYETIKEENNIRILPSLDAKSELFLVVDDNIKMRLFITNILNNYGYTCLHAQNGIEALNLIAENTINFIVTDYMMPKMNGFDLIKNLKKQKIDIPILMLTAKNDTKSRLDVFRLGIDDYLTKPFENNEFIIRIENALNNYKERTQYILQKNISFEETKETDYWIYKVETYILECCSNLEFKQADIANHFNMSISTLYRKIKSSRGLSPNELVKEIKLQKAHEILTKDRTIPLKQLALEVGFQHTSYFSKIYENRFGIKPFIKKVTPTSIS